MAPSAGCWECRARPSACARALLCLQAAAAGRCASFAARLLLHWAPLYPRNAAPAGPAGSDVQGSEQWREAQTFMAAHPMSEEDPQMASWNGEHSTVRPALWRGSVQPFAWESCSPLRGKRGGRRWAGEQGRVSGNKWVGRTKRSAPTCRTPSWQPSLPCAPPLPGRCQAALPSASSGGSGTRWRRQRRQGRAWSWRRTTR